MCYTIQMKIQNIKNLLKFHEKVMWPNIHIPYINRATLASRERNR